MPLANEKMTGHTLSNVEKAEKLFVEHGDFIRSVIYFNIKNEVEGEDVFQDLFLHFVSKPIPDDIQNIKGFLYRVICDRIKDAIRRISRYQARLERYARHHTNIIDYRPEKAVVNMEESQKMFELIQKHLPPNEAHAITLRHSENYNTAETAVKMGIKPKSVSRYVSVGIKKLRQVLAESKGGNDNAC